MIAYILKDKQIRNACETLGSNAGHAFYVVIVLGMVVSCNFIEWMSQGAQTESSVSIPVAKI